MFKRLFLLTLIFSLGFTSIGLTQTPGGESTVTIGEPFISASTGKVTRYGTCGMVSHDYKDCQNSSGPGIYHPVTFEWKARDTVDIRISTVASGYGKVRAVLAKVIINGVDKIGGDAGDASRATPTYIGDCGVISTWRSTHAQAYTETKTAACIYTGPAGSDRAATERGALIFLKTHKATHLLQTPHDPQDSFLNRNPEGIRFFRPLYPKMHFATAPIKLYEIQYPPDIKAELKYLGIETKD